MSDGETSAVNTGASGEFGAWLRRFFASYYRHRPVNATFIGKHDYDPRLPDFSAAGVAVEDVDDDAGAPGQGVDVTAELGESGHDQGRGPPLLAGQLGVGVDIPTQLGQGRFVGADDGL